MVGLNSKYVRLVFIFLMATLQIACSTQDKKENIGQISSIADTLNYEQKDYDLMRDYFSSDSTVLSNLNKRVEVGDTNAIKLKKLLTSEYDSRRETGVTDSEIDALIFSYYTIKKVTDRFKGIDSSLREATGGPDAVRRKTDSLNNAIEELKKKMEDMVRHAN